MSNSKYDWEPYMPNIIQMYLDEKPVSYIHVAIQDPINGFKPGARRVYDILNERGYPTKPEERKAFLSHYRSGIWQNNVNAVEHPSVGHDLPLVASLPSNDTTQSSHTTFTVENTSIVSDAQDLDLSLAADANSSKNKNKLDNSEKDHGQELSQATYLSGDGPGPSDEPIRYLDWLFEEEGLSGEGEGRITTQLNLQYDQVLGRSLQTKADAATRVAFQRQSHGDHTAKHACNHVIPLHSSMAVSNTLETDQMSIVSSNECPAVARPSVSPPSSLSSSQRPCTQSRKSVSNTPTFQSRFSAILPSRFRLDRSSSPSKRASTSMRDSGYVSGRNSPFALLELEEEQHDIPPTDEFKGLYRVPCKQHEPQPAIFMPMMPAARERQSKEQYKNVTTCPDCLYSAIHNLSWSATHLKLQVFQAELKLDSLYNITALDIVGNSALHYAAAGGADSEYFVSLMQVGVDPYRLNTEGQLFLHCLRPNETAGLDSLELLSINLVNTLNHMNSLDPKGTSASLHWRDNEGRTVLDTLVTHIPDVAMKNQTFRLIQNAGYPLKLSQQFPEQISTSGFLDNQNHPGPGSEFSVTQYKQQRAYEILVCALSDQPNYVDPETGDNVLHALARLKLSEKGSLLSKVQEFVSKDVDLNLQNRDRHSPLAAFIQERPFLGIESEETGATMSKYLDALLWKDTQRRVPNKINVNMRNREGAPALFYAAVRARPDSVRSLIEAGANVNACLNINGCSQSILQATLNARSAHVNDAVKMHLYKEVISFLEHEGAVAEPTLLQERGLCSNSVMVMPL